MKCLWPVEYVYTYFMSQELKILSHSQVQAIVVRAIKSQVLVARRKSYFTITFDGVEIYFE